MTAPTKTGRLPVDQAGAGRQEIWLAIKAVNGPFKVSDIAAAAGVHRGPVMRYLKALTAAGYLESIATLPGQASHWTLVQDVGHHAPRVRSDGTRVTQGEITGQIWRAMYMLKDFSFLDLIHNASVEVAEATAKDYCKRLLAAGYLKVLVKADPHAARPARYRLIRHSGPKAPQVQRVRQVYDPNTGSVYMAEGQP